MTEATAAEQQLTAVMACLDDLQAYTSAALDQHITLNVAVPSNLSALPDAVSKVGMALRNLQDAITISRDVATRGNPVGYGLPVPEPLVLEPVPEPEPAPEPEGEL